MHAEEFGVDVDEAGGDAGEGFFLGEQTLGFDHFLLDEVAPGFFGSGAVFGEGEEGGFGALEDAFGAEVGAVAGFGDFAGGVEDAPEEVVFEDALDVVFGVGDGGGAGDDGQEGVFAAGGFEAPGLGEVFDEGRDFEGAVGGRHLEHGFVDGAVAAEVEGFGDELVDAAEVEHGLGVEEDGPEGDGLGFFAVGREQSAGTGGRSLPSRLVR